MSVNGTGIPPTVPYSSSPPSAGLAAGLTVVFLLLAIIVGVIIYKYHGAIMSIVPFRQRKVQEKEETYTETPQADPHECTDMVQEQSIDPSPIYENLKTQTTGYNVAAANQSRFPVESEDDVYLQCDAVDEGIYSNDPAHDTTLTGSQEDVYIVPDVY